MSGKRLETKGQAMDAHQARTMIRIYSMFEYISPQDNNIPVRVRKRIDSFPGLYNTTYMNVL